MKETIGTDFMMSTKGDSICRKAFDFDATQLNTMAQMVAATTLPIIRDAETATALQLSAFEKSSKNVEATLIGPGNKKPVPPKDAASCQRRRIKNTPSAAKKILRLLFSTVVEIVRRHAAADGLWIHLRQ